MPASLVVCPVCGRKNRPEDTFRCRDCGRDNLCLRHQDEEAFLCRDCVAKMREDARRKVRESMAVTISEEVEAAKVEIEAKLAALSAERNRPVAALPVTAAGVTFNLRRIPAKVTQAAFWMGETPVTQALWTAVMGSNPSHFTGDDQRPVENVSLNDCQDFLKKLNTLDEVRRSDLVFRLPSSDEWEHACRAGSMGKYCRLADGTEITAETLGRVAWFDKNAGVTTHPVGRKEPNAWGLYDMHGNVWEWTETKTAFGEIPVYRGGSWFNSARNCGSSFRYWNSPSNRDYIFGFRLCASGRV